MKMKICAVSLSKPLLESGGEHERIERSSYLRRNKGPRGPSAL